MPAQAKKFMRGTQMMIEPGFTDAKAVKRLQYNTLK